MHNKAVGEPPQAINASGVADGALGTTPFLQGNSDAHTASIVASKIRQCGTTDLWPDESTPAHRQEKSHPKRTDRRHQWDSAEGLSAGGIHQARPTRQSKG